MKKICFVTTIYGTYRSFLKEFSLFLEGSGDYEISLICDGESIIEGDVPTFVKVYPVKMERGVSLTAFSSILAIMKVFKDNKFDIVQYSTPNAAFYASIAAKISNVPIRLYCQWGIRYMGFKGGKRKLFKLIEKITCNNSTFIEAESNTIREFSCSEYLYNKNKSSVIWNGSASGVDLKKFNICSKMEWRKEVRNKFQFKEEDIVYAFAGRLTADKGVNELLDAFLKLYSQNTHVKLLVMGAFDNEKTLNAELLDRARKCPSISFTGNVNELEKYYAAADVFVAPSYREGFGLVVIEAGAMGLPAIVSNVPGQIDAIKEKETGLSFQVKDSESLLFAMKMLYQDSELRIKMSESAHMFVSENFNQKILFEYLKKHRDELIMSNQKVGMQWH